jgi:hypothetical protein
VPFQTMLDTNLELPWTQSLTSISSRLTMSSRRPCATWALFSATQWPQSAATPNPMTPQLKSSRPRDWAVSQRVPPTLWVRHSWNQRTPACRNLSSCSKVQSANFWASLQASHSGRDALADKTNHDPPVWPAHRLLAIANLLPAQQHAPRRWRHHLQPPPEWVHCWAQMAQRIASHPAAQQAIPLLQGMALPPLGQPPLPGTQPPLPTAQPPLFSPPPQYQPGHQAAAQKLNYASDKSLKDRHPKT